MGILTKEEIRNTQDSKIEKVEIPEWGGEVYVKSLTVKERGLWEKKVFERKGNNVETNWAEARQLLAIMSTCDEEGNLIFNKADLDWISGKSSAALDRIFSVAQKLSYISKEDLEKMTKNFESDQSEDSPSS